MKLQAYNSALFTLVTADVFLIVMINQSRVYYKVVALESELRSYLQYLLKTINIKMYLVLHALCYNNCFTNLWINTER
jgi:hypothetical protein